MSMPRVLLPWDQPSCHMKIWSCTLEWKTHLKMLVCLSGCLGSSHHHDISSLKMTILSFFIPCHHIAGFEFSAFWACFSEERKLMFPWALLLCLFVTSYPKEYFSRLDHFNPDWSVGRRLKRSRLPVFCEKRCLDRGGKYPNKSFILC